MLETILAIVLSTFLKYVLFSYSYRSKSHGLRTNNIRPCKNNNCYSILLKKGSYELPKNTFFIKYELYYNRIDVSEGLDVNKTRQLKECDIFHYYFSLYSLNKGFEFQRHVCNGCKHLLLVSKNLSKSDILKIRSADYCCIISRISKSEVINLMQNIDLTENSVT